MQASLDVFCSCSLFVGSLPFFCFSPAFKEPRITGPSPPLKKEGRTLWWGKRCFRKQACCQKKDSGASFAATLPGVTEPLGFWDPAGFCSTSEGFGAEKPASEGKVRFYREVPGRRCRESALVQSCHGAR